MTPEPMAANNEPIRRQFIAGAFCPSCKVVDKVRRCEDAAATIWLECIACGYTQDLTSGHAAAGADAEGVVEVRKVRVHGPKD